MASHGFRKVAFPLLLLAAVSIAASSQTVAQTCRTSNCDLASTPPSGCANRAAPRTLTVQQLSFVFQPNDPLIEPGDCVEWDSTDVLHSSTQDGCPDVLLCNSPPPPSCSPSNGRWEAGNVLPGAPVVCFYDATFFTPSTKGYYCRPHSDPLHSGTMFGFLTVTTAIRLRISKSGNDVIVNWFGGGADHKLEKSANDPTFASGTTIPAVGSANPPFIDTGEINNTANDQYYLVRNKQSDEP